jgi:hypothetical protein
MMVKLWSRGPELANHARTTFRHLAPRRDSIGKALAMSYRHPRPRRNALVSDRFEAQPFLRPLGPVTIM